MLHALKPYLLRDNYAQLVLVVKLSLTRTTVFNLCNFSFKYVLPSYAQQKTHQPHLWPPWLMQQFLHIPSGFFWFSQGRSDDFFPQVLHFSIAEAQYWYCPRGLINSF